MGRLSGDFSSSGTVNHEDWGTGWNMVLESGNVIVSSEIQLHLQLETIPDKGTVATPNERRPYGSCRESSSSCKPHRD